MTAVTSAERNRAWYDRHIERERERGRTKYLRKVGTAEGAANNLWRGAKQRAAKKGIDFNLNKEAIQAVIEAGHCEVTGLPFDLSGGKNPFGPTIDRNVAALGYVQGNYKVVVWAYNAAKGCGTHEDVLTLCRALTGVGV